MQNHPKNPRPDDGDAFIPDPSVHDGPTRGADAEFFAEEFLTSATTGENVEQDAADDVVEEELGGPFLEEGVADEDMADTLPEPPPISTLR